MNNFFRLTALLFGVLLSTFIHAADIQVEGAWARATLPDQDDGMVSFAITSKQDATLIGITSTACKSVEIHSMTHDNGMMKMREMKTVALPAGKAVDFEKRGYHLMLIGLNSPLKEGGNVPLTLHIKNKNQRMIDIKTLAAVKSITAVKATDGEDAHSHHH